MFWLMALVVAGVVFTIVAVAAGRGGTLAEVAGDPRPLAGHESPVTAIELEQLRFPVTVRGYRMEYVDEVLDRVGLELAVRDARIEELETRLGMRARSGVDPADPARPELEV